MKVSRRLAAAIAALCTLVLIVAAAAAPVLWFKAEDDRLAGQPLTRRRQDSPLAPEGEDNYLVRTLHARNEQLMQGKTGGGFRETAAAPDELRPGLTAALDAMAKAGVLPAALCSRLAVLMEQETTSFACAEDGAGFRQFRLRFYGAEWQTLGLECEPLTGRVVNLWLAAGQQGDTAAPGGAAGNEVSAASQLSPPAGLEAPPMISELLPALDAGAALEAYKAWLGLDTLDDWAAAGGGYYDLRATSEKAQAQLFILCKGSVLLVGIVPLGGRPAGG